MKTHSTEDEIFERSSKEELKLLAARGQLSWRGKKVVLDPFTPIELFYEIDSAGDQFSVRGRVRVGGQEDDLTACEVFSAGAIQHQIFRFWKDGFKKIKDQVSLMELKDLVEDEAPLVWKCPIPRWKPEPLPIFILKDRTGAFADLWMDYGPQGREMFKGGLEEQLWEKDLLETDFIRKRVGDTHYFCPMDKVVKSLTFLLDIGWAVIDAQGKKVVRQGAAEWKSETQGEAILVKGRIAYGAHTADAKNVMGSFNRRERFIDLSPSEVGLLEFPAAWILLAEEEIGSEGILVKRRHIGLLEEIVPLPPEYLPAQWKSVVPGEGFLGRLFDYQQEGLEWLSYLYRSGFSGLLADEMGLGKTIQVMAFLSTLEIEKPFLIVMPVSLLFHWKREFEKFLPSILEQKKVILISYAQLRIDRIALESMQFSGVILDEAQAIKNPDTLTSQIACRLQAPFKLAMTGTPIENRFDDLWSLFRYLMPGLLGERKDSFVMERVRKKIRPFTLRRTKALVALQLPEKQEQIVWIEREEKEQNFYDQFLKEKRGTLIQKVKTEGLSSQKMEILEIILRLRQICCHPRLVAGEYAGESGKFTRVCNDLEEVVGSGCKVLLYSQFTSVLRLFKPWLEEKGWKYAYLDGQTKDREKEVEAFQTDPSIQVFLMSLKAGGVGLNLQAADYVFLYDPWWNEAVEKQAVDRAHRLGRKDTVIARKYLVVETIEEKILKLQGHKRSLAENLLEFEGEVAPITLEELYQVLTN